MAFVRYENDLQAIPATVYIGLGHAQRIPDYWELFLQLAQMANGQAYRVLLYQPIQKKPHKWILVFNIAKARLTLGPQLMLGQVRDYL